ncbi:MAG TPA: IS5 family transposase [Gemmatimonadales bacterium]|nr:IS5 family transposase [Gemmatimonadales bacterium]
MSTRNAYPSDVRDEEWAFVAPYLTLLPVTAGQREHSLREVFNGLRWIVRTGAPWRYVPHDLPPWAAVYQQTQRWLRAGVFESIVHDLRSLLRVLQGRKEQPSAAVLDSRTLRSTRESGSRAGNDPHKKTRGSKVHLSVDTLGHLLSLVVTAANEQDRDAVAAIAQATQEATGESVEVAFVDGAYAGPKAQAAARPHGIELQVVKVPEGTKGFVLLPKRWVVERSFAWLSRFRRLARDYERLPETLAGLHVVAFACVMLGRAFSLLEIGS